MPSARPHIVLIDGDSGAGKSTLATTMADALGATLVRLDDLYPGWDGLVAGRDAAIADVIEPLARGDRGVYVSWNWTDNEPGDRRVVEPADIVIVEGCGISTPLSRAIADTTIWVSCAVEVREERLRDRDGNAFDEYWNTWDAQVAAHVVENDPIVTATVLVEG